MSQELRKVSAEDFTKLTTERLPHQDIENALIAMGGGGVKGMDFKNNALKKAGWKGDRLTSFAKKPEDAAKAFNTVRKALKETDDKDGLIAALGK